MDNAFAPKHNYRLFTIWTRLRQKPRMEADGSGPITLDRHQIRKAASANWKAARIQMTSDNEALERIIPGDFVLLKRQQVQSLAPLEGPYKVLDVRGCMIRIEVQPGAQIWHNRRNLEKYGSLGARVVQ